MSPALRRLVHLTKQLPHPEDSGGKLRTARVLAELSRHAEEVVLLGFTDGAQAPPAEVFPRSAAGDPPRVVAADRSLRHLPAGFARSRSLAVGRWASPQLRAAVERWDGPGTHLHVDFPQLLVNLPPGRVPDSLDLHNIESDLLRQRTASLPQGPTRWLARSDGRAFAAWEDRWSAVPLVTCCTDEDRRRLAARGTDAVVVPNGTDLPARVTPVPTAPTAVFVGSLDWAPNVEGLLWFARAVWPRVVAAVPGARLELVGRRPVTEVRALAAADPSIVVHADVPSVTPHLEGARVSVCPLLTGGGSRLKIVESLGHGRPVISTTLGAEGLLSLAGEGLELVDAPDDLARALAAALVAPPAEVAAAGLRGRAAVERSWSWEAALAPLRTALTGPGREPPRRGQPPKSSR